jgi:hypothetical protein
MSARMWTWSWNSAAPVRYPASTTLEVGKRNEQNAKLRAGDFQALRWTQPGDSARLSAIRDAPGNRLGQPLDEQQNVPSRATRSPHRRDPMVTQIGGSGAPADRRIVTQCDSRL